MAHPARVAGHRGRKPAKPAGARFAIKYVADYAPFALPPAQYPVDVSGGIKDWRMLGNGPDPSVPKHPDGVGDCTFAGREHYKMAKAAAGNETETFESAADLVDEYLRYDHGRDEGANIADLLLAWYKAGKILAFAPVDYTGPEQVDAAMQAFHGVYAGVALTDDADQLFEEHKAWTVAGGQDPDPLEGHCILKVGAEGGHGDDTWVTWGAVQRSTAAWTAVCLEEAWVIITQEDALAANLDIDALRADIDALHGTGGNPAPAPPAPPAPTPSPDPLADLAAILRSAIASVEAWLRKHGL